MKLLLKITFICVFIFIIKIFGGGCVLSEDIIEYVTAEESCADRCHMELASVNTRKTPNEEPTPCTCTLDCMTTKTCCVDYVSECWTKMPSCAGQCQNSEENVTMPCQCGSYCVSHDNCCPDYHKMCLMDRVSDEELEDIAESLLFWDQNTLMDALIIRLQGRTDTECDNSNARDQLLEFNSSVSMGATYIKLMALYDDYIADTNQTEVIEKDDIYAFLTLILQTRLMQGVQNFLVDKGFVDEKHFVNTMKRIWFENYNRGPQGTALGSSGFESVFLGELMSTEVIGFQNWVRFLNQSGKTGKIQYNGYLDQLVLNKKATVVTINFEWQGKCKAISSMFVGTSPEFELALFTLCWFTRPNVLCPVVLGGHHLHIQTYEEVNYLGQKFVDKAFPVITSNGASLHHHCPLQLQTNLYKYALLFLVTVFVTYFK